MAVKGLQKVLKNLQKFGAEAAVEVDKTTELIVKDIVADAKINAPKDMGKLAQSIYEVALGESNYKVVVNKEYAAYVEFGTGTKVQVPSELYEMASKFKGAGIKEVNIQAQPYLYPAFVKGRKRYKKDLKDLLKILTKKYE